MWSDFTVLRIPIGDGRNKQDCLVWRRTTLAKVIVATQTVARLYLGSDLKWRRMWRIEGDAFDEGDLKSTGIWYPGSVRKPCRQREGLKRRTHILCTSCFSDNDLNATLQPSRQNSSLQVIHSNYVDSRCPTQREHVISNKQEGWRENLSREALDLS